MAKKPVSLFLLLFIGVLYAKAQNCGTIEKNTIEKSRMYFIDYESYSITNIDSLLQNINFADTAIVKKILLNGAKKETYEAFFATKNVIVKRIAYNDFNALQFDSLILNTEEKRHEAKYKKLIEKHYNRLKNDKPDKAISKKIRKAKYLELERKRTSLIPLLFKMYPIYTYQNHTLIMYSIYSNKHGIPFIYEICKSY